MNNSYYPNNNIPNIPMQGNLPPLSGGTVNGTYPQQMPQIIQPEYADNIFQRNIGKKVSAYMSYPDSIEWRDRVFSGIIKSAGRDFLLLDSNGSWILLWTIYINYAIFDERVNY